MQEASGRLSSERRPRRRRGRCSEFRGPASPRGLHGQRTPALTLNADFHIRQSRFPRAPTTFAGASLAGEVSPPSPLLVRLGGTMRQQHPSFLSRFHPPSSKRCPEGLVLSLHPLHSAGNFLQPPKLRFQRKHDKTDAGISPSTATVGQSLLKACSHTYNRVGPTETRPTFHPLATA